MNIIEAKAAARRLSRRLADLGVTVSSTQSLEAVAAVADQPNWNRFRALLSQPASPGPAPRVIARGVGGGIAGICSLYFAESIRTNTPCWLLEISWILQQVPMVNKIIPALPLLSVTDWANAENKMYLTPTFDAACRMPQAHLKVMSCGEGASNEYIHSYSQAGDICSPLARYFRRWGLSPRVMIMLGHPTGDSARLRSSAMELAQAGCEVLLFTQGNTFGFEEVAAMEPTSLDAIDPVPLEHWVWLNDQLLGWRPDKCSAAPNDELRALLKRSNAAPMVMLSEYIEAAINSNRNRHQTEFTQVSMIV